MIRALLNTRCLNSMKFILLALKRFQWQNKKAKLWTKAFLALVTLQVVNPNWLWISNKAGRLSPNLSRSRHYIKLASLQKCRITRSIPLSIWGITQPANLYRFRVDLIPQLPERTSSVAPGVTSFWSGIINKIRQFMLPRPHCQRDRLQNKLSIHHQNLTSAQELIYLLSRKNQL